MQVPAVERHASTRADEAGDRVDERCLAGAVGPDQADELALTDLEADLAQRVDTMEIDRQALDCQHRRRRRTRRTRLAPGVCPSGRLVVARSPCRKWRLSVPGSRCRSRLPSAPGNGRPPIL